MKKEPSDFPKDSDKISPDAHPSIPPSAPETNNSGRDRRSNSKKITQLAAIAGAVALLAVVMYPGSVFPHSASQDAAANNSPNDTATIKTYPPLTAEQQTICSSVHDELVSVIATGAGSNGSQDGAVDMLDGVYCNRADLVDAIGSTSYPATGLAAYACEASNGNINDKDAADALRPYAALYCLGATSSLQSEISDLQAAASAISDNPKFADASKQITQDIAQAQNLAADKPYSAYQQLQSASKEFENLPAA